MMLNAQFKLVHSIGHGSFGQVYLALDLNDGDKHVAVKTESITQSFSQLVKEIQNYSVLKGKGFPKLIK